MSEKHFFLKKFGANEYFSYFCRKYIMTRMKKRLLILSFATMMLVGLPMTVAAIPVAPGIEQLVDDDIVISVNGQTVTVTGAQGQTLEVVSLTGRRVMTVKVDSPAQKFELNIPKGCYILKIGKVVRKVSVR